MHPESETPLVNVRLHPCPTHPRSNHRWLHQSCGIKAQFLCEVLSNVNIEHAVAVGDVQDPPLFGDALT